MATEETFQFEIQSLHPYKSAQQLVDEIRASLPEIAAELESEEGSPSLDLEQAETFPVDPHTIYFAVKAILLAGAGGAAKSFGEKFGGELYEALKRRFKNATIKTSVKRSVKKR